VSRLWDAIDLLDVQAWIEQYVETKSGGPTELILKDCPKCHNNKGKLYVNPEKKVWICYVCEWGRNQHDIVILLSAISDRSLNDIRKEILEAVPAAVSGDMEEQLTKALNQNPDEQLDLALPISIELPGSDNFTTLTGQRVLAYCGRRGVKMDDIVRYKLRLSGKLGMTANSDRKWPGPFLVFPVFDTYGTPVGYQGRHVDGRDPKYVSSKSIANWLWPVENLRPWISLLILVEGPFDAMGLQRLGYTALCTFGKKLSLVQEHIIRELKPETLLFAWDLDAMKEIQRTVSRMSYAFDRVLVADFEHPSGKKVDPGDALNDVSVAAWIHERIAGAIDVASPEFLEWQLAKV